MLRSFLQDRKMAHSLRAFSEVLDRDSDLKEEWASLNPHIPYPQIRISEAMQALCTAILLAKTTKPELEAEFRKAAEQLSRKVLFNEFMSKFMRQAILEDAGEPDGFEYLVPLPVLQERREFLLSIAVRQQGA